MAGEPNKHRRRSIRLKNYDYTQAGAYFITICTQGRVCLFGEVANGEMRLNDAGRIAQAAWDDLPNHYLNVGLDAFIAMPNHVHGIVVLTDAPVVGAGLKPAPTVKPAPTIPATRHELPEIIRVGAIHESPLHESPLPHELASQSPTQSGPAHIADRRRMLLSKIVGRFKMVSAKQINTLRGTTGRAVWQRNYYEHIVRNDEPLDRIRRYILDNPTRWSLDGDNPITSTRKGDFGWR